MFAQAGEAGFIEDGADGIVFQRLMAAPDFRGHKKVHLTPESN
jgi:hypothetical protein